MSWARSWIHSNSLVIILLLACTTDKTKLWLSLSEKQHQDPCPGSPPMYQDLCNDWPVIAKFVVSRCAFCKLQRNFGFFCSVNHLSGPLRKHMFTCEWCISIQSVCSCVSWFVWFVACNRPFSGYNWLVFSRQKFHSSLRFPLLFLTSLESFSVLFLRAKLGECIAL